MILPVLLFLELVFEHVELVLEYLGQMPSAQEHLSYPLLKRHCLDNGKLLIHRFQNIQENICMKDVISEPNNQWKTIITNNSLILN